MPYFSIRQESHLRVLKDNRILCSLWLLNGAKLPYLSLQKYFTCIFKQVAKTSLQWNKVKMSDTGGETIAISSPAPNLISCCTRVLGWGQGVQRFRVLWKEKSIQYPGFAYKYMHIKLHILYLKFRISNVIASSDKKKFCVCYWSSIFRSQKL